MRCPRRVLLFGACVGRTSPCPHNSGRLLRKCSRFCLRFLRLPACSLMGLKPVYGRGACREQPSPHTGVEVKLTVPLR